MDLEQLKINEIRWQKRNFWIRLILIGILIYIAGQVIFYKYGYEDPDMQVLRNEMTNTTITCKQALYYFAENELQIYSKNNRKENLDRLNISDWQTSFNLSLVAKP